VDAPSAGVNCIDRLCREEGLTIRKRRARRRAVGTQAPNLVEAKEDARWPLDFVHDQFCCGRRFRVLNIVDDVRHECLAAIPDTSISVRRVARELTDLISRRRRPGMFVSDHGTEFTSNAILAWAVDFRREVTRAGARFPLRIDPCETHPLAGTGGGYRSDRHGVFEHHPALGAARACAHP
jgi:putative transposase